MKKILLILLITICLSIFVQGTNCPTNPPVIYTGTISSDGGIDVNGETIKANIGGEIAGESTVSDNSYTIDVSPCVGASGSISFSINGKGANEDADYNGMDDWGKTITLDLTFGSIPEEDPCGNGDIDIGEECDTNNLGEATCASHLGENWIGDLACTATCEFNINSCTHMCVEDWNCTEWSSCSEGTQTRTCTDNNACTTEESKPEESQSCDDGSSSSSSSSGSSSSGSSSSGSSSGGGGGGGYVPKKQCNDKKDNDGDGLIDYPEDLGCTSTTDNDETNHVPATITSSSTTTTSTSSDDDEEISLEPGEQIVINKESGEVVDNSLTGASVGSFGETTGQKVLIAIIILAVLAGVGSFFAMKSSNKKPVKKRKK